jgi:hypothetical protein
MNCWEFMKCGREEGGANAGEEGVCPAYPDSGKICARVTGTLCDGEVQGTFATKLGDCLKCDFYKSGYYGTGDDESLGKRARRTSTVRKEERTIAFKPVIVFGINGSYSAISMNYSRSGLAMITNLDVSPGDSLKISCESFWREPKEAVVVWESRISKSSKKVGLSLCG